jgi:hypothetical protein
VSFFKQSASIIDMVTYVKLGFTVVKYLRAEFHAHREETSNDALNSIKVESSRGFALERGSNVSKPVNNRQIIAYFTPSPVAMAGRATSSLGEIAKP